LPWAEPEDGVGVTPIKVATTEAEAHTPAGRSRSATRRLAEAFRRRDGWLKPFTDETQMLGCQRRSVKSRQTDKLSPGE
jgi:hypothetical protein